MRQRRPKERTAELDAIDRAIVRALQTDGRMSYASLAEKIDLSQAAARQRVNKLIDSGVMEVVAITDPLKLGYSVQADLGINVSGDPRPVVEALQAMPEVEYLRFTAGRFEIMAEVLFPTSEELHEFVNGRLRDIPGIERVESLVVLQRVKETHDWGVLERERDD